jgi:hypothetical protein
MGEIERFTNESEGGDLSKGPPGMVLEGLRKMIWKRFTLRDHPTFKWLKNKLDFRVEKIIILHRRPGSLEKIRVGRSWESSTFLDLTRENFVLIKKRKWC